MKTHALNQSINFFWTILCFAPVLWYWYAAGWATWAWIILGISFLPTFFPDKLIQRMQLAKTRRGFERLGAKTFRKLTQDGDWAKAATHSTGSTIGNLEGAEKYLSTIRMYEKFHWICGIFFGLTAIHAFATGYWITGVLVTIANFIFNFAAIVLQQYNRLRIGNALRNARRIDI
ncbi:hypothetical protein [Chitinophaga sp.]|uniref:glycosyl-4,4'-diaponeurosporenoate acyltransferase CrtO family protein n=1 Tax=Chitinophaga sp. TaxID=1869181 RepID=UPI00260684DE|nr:hypothetical protein [uncultured Chitinophaga sp.]